MGVYLVSWERELSDQLQQRLDVFVGESQLGQTQVLDDSVGLDAFTEVAETLAGERPVGTDVQDLDSSSCFEHVGHLMHVLVSES
jgi:hypothetical protein